jgi:hypothetical protein
MNFADVLAKDIENFNPSKKQQCTNEFDQKWSELGRIVHSVVISEETQTRVPAVFGYLRFRDLLVGYPNHFFADDQNLFCHVDIPFVKFTTWGFIGEENGFYEQIPILQKNEIKTIIAFEFNESRPKIYEHSGIQCYAIPFIYDLHTIFFLITKVFNSSKNEISNIPSETSVSNLGNVNVGNEIDHIIENFKKNNPQSKPTIPKISEFTGQSQEQIKKLITKSGKTWTELLIKFGFRNN